MTRTNRLFAGLSVPAVLAFLLAAMAPTLAPAGPLQAADPTQQTAAKRRCMINVGTPSNPRWVRDPACGITSK